MILNFKTIITDIMKSGREEGRGEDQAYKTYFVHKEVTGRHYVVVPKSGRFS